MRYHYRMKSSKDPFAYNTVKEKLISASWIVNPLSDDIYIQQSQFQDEFFVLSRGITPLPKKAAIMAADTSVWAYKVVQKRQYYMDDKRSFMKRIYRTTNLTFWQKQKEDEYKPGLHAELVVAMVGDKTCWVGTIGEGGVWVMHNNRLISLLKPSKRELLGVERTPPIPSFAYERFNSGDLLILFTRDFCTIMESHIRVVVENHMSDEDDIDGLLREIQQAIPPELIQNGGMWIIRRIQYEQKILEIG